LDFEAAITDELMVVGPMVYTTDVRVERKAMAEGSDLDGEGTPSKRALMKMLQGEGTLFKKFAWHLVPTISFGIYMFLIVFRRVSFYVEKYGIESGTLSNGPLYDLGSVIFTWLLGTPDMTIPVSNEEREKNIEHVVNIIHHTDTFMSIIQMIIFFVPFASWYGAWANGRIPKKTVYLANYFNRYVYVLILGHFMRFLSYTFTVVPGPSYHCRPEFTHPETGVAYADMIPKTATSIFFPSSRDMKYIGFNCGDLVFSGHMYTNVISYYYFWVYSKRVYTEEGWKPNSKNARLVLLFINTVCLIGTAACILGSRQHYSVDVVLATYMGLLLPYWYDDNLAPKEIDPFSDGSSDDGEGDGNNLVPQPTRTPLRHAESHAVTPSPDSAC
jgi:hypothetical protein